MKHIVKRASVLFFLLFCLAGTITGCTDDNTTENREDSDTENTSEDMDDMGELDLD